MSHSRADHTTSGIKCLHELQYHTPTKTVQTQCKPISPTHHTHTNVTPSEASVAKCGDSGTTTILAASISHCCVWSLVITSALRIPHLVHPSQFSDVGDCGGCATRPVVFSLNLSFTWTILV